MSEGSNVSDAVNKAFEKYLDAICELRNQFLTEGKNLSGAHFSAIRVAMVACAMSLFNSPGGEEAPDEDFREILHGILDEAISDFQFNMRLHIPSKGS